MSIKSLLISCVGDIDLAGKIHSFLTPHFDASRLSIAEDEIRISDVHKKSEIKNLIESFIDSKEEYKKYKVSEFGDTITVGNVVDVEQIGLFECTSCGYLVQTEEELAIHRKTHDWITSSFG